MTSEAIERAAIFKQPAIFEGSETIECRDLSDLPAASAVLAARAETRRRALQASTGREVVYVSQQAAWRDGRLELATRLGHSHPLDGYLGDDGRFHRFQP